MIRKIPQDKFLDSLEDMFTLLLKVVVRSEQLFAEIRYYPCPSCSEIELKILTGNLG